MAAILENYYNNKKIKTILGKNTNFNGDLTFKDSLKINGTFIGTISASGILVIGENASIQANINAKTIVVYGAIKGNVTAEEKVEMFSSAKVFGNVKAKKIKISDGVVFNGKCEIVT